MGIKKNGHLEFTITIKRLVINTFPWWLIGKERRESGLYLDLGFVAIGLLKGESNE